MCSFVNFPWTLSRNVDGAIDIIINSDASVPHVIIFHVLLTDELCAPPPVPSSLARLFAFLGSVEGVAGGVAVACCTTDTACSINERVFYLFTFISFSFRFASLFLPALPCPALPLLPSLLFAGSCAHFLCHHWRNVWRSIGLSVCLSVCRLTFAHVESLFICCCFFSFSLRCFA